MQRVLIIGAGGHGQVVADCLLQTQRRGAGVAPIGFVDDNPALTGVQRIGLPVWGQLADLPSIAHDAIIIAIGNNHLRSRLFLELTEQGEQFVIACHPTAIIAPDVQLGVGTVIGPGAIVNVGAKIGANVILNTGCTVDHHTTIAQHAHIGPGVHLGGDVSIGAGCLIGIGATVMPQRQVGDWSVAGAGALVHIDLPANVVAYGVPAQIHTANNKER